MTKTITKNQVLNREEELKTELQKISDQKYKLMIAEHYPKFKKKYEGKFFKYRNSYGSGSGCQDWWLYIAVTSIKPEDVYDTNGNGITSSYGGWSFQTTSSGEISIDKKRRGYVHSVLGSEISEKEFTAAYNKMIDEINKLG